MFGAKPTGFGTTFGTGSSFGTSTPFGQTPASTGFATPSSFGATTPATGGLFGGTSTTTAGGGLFGQQSASTFGQSAGFNFSSTPNISSTSGLFSGQQPQQTSSLFSTPATSNAFGAKTPAFGGFGATTTSTNLFGSTALPNTSSSLFGTTTAFGTGNVPTGTTVKFIPLAGSETVMKNGVTTNVNTRHQCISGMKEYESKSLEELRVEDYTANRKQAGAATGGMFGGATTAAQPGTGLVAFNQPSTAFGATSAFGAPTSSAAGTLFGTTPLNKMSTPFGQQNKTLFGGTAPSTSTGGFPFGQTSTNASTSLFGQPTQAKPLFGTATTTTPQQTGLFGNTAASGFSAPGFGFGTQPQAQTTGLFGNKTAFGATPATTSSLFSFGQTPANTAGGLFSKPATTSVFGFGQTNTNTLGFGATNASTGLFGARPTGFGTQANTVLGTTPAFGSTLGTGFGTAAAPQGSTLFGSVQNKPAFSFGLNTGTGALGTNTTNTFSFGNTSGITGAITDTSTAKQVEIQQQLMSVISSPYGDSPLYWNLKRASTNREEVLKPTNPAAQKAALNSVNQYKIRAQPSPKAKPKSLHSIMNGSKGQIFDGLDEEDFSYGNDTFNPKRSIKKLVLRNKTNSTAGTLSRSFVDESTVDGESGMQLYEPVQKITDGTPVRSRGRDLTYDCDTIIKSKLLINSVNSADTPQSSRRELDDTMAVLNSRGKPQAYGSDSADENTSVLQVDSTVEDDETEHNHVTHPTGIVLTRPSYYTVPSLDELTTMIDENGDCWVENFTIGREGYGSIFYSDFTNVASLNLDEIVHFRRKEVTVYPDDDTKPELGEGLNKTAEITLDCVWPNDKSNKSPIKSPDRLNNMNYQKRIELATARMGAKFVDYRPETGSWVFEVKHFSKYGLADDSDEELTEQEKKQLKALQDQQLKVQKQKVAHAAIIAGKKVLDGQLQHQQLLASGDIIGQQKAFPPQKVEPMAEDDDDEDTIAGLMGDETADDLLMRDSQDLDMDGDHIPSSHRLASSLGVDPRNMQAMKASFFAEDDGDSGHALQKPRLEDSHPSMALGPVAEGLGKGFSLFGPSLRSKFAASPSRTQVDKVSKIKEQDTASELHSFSGTPSGLDSMVRPIKSFFPQPSSVPEHITLTSGMPQERPKRVAGMRAYRELPRVQASLTYRKQQLLHDAGCFMGRSFRVGWGPGWTLVHSGHVITEKTTVLETKGPFSLFSGQQSVSHTRIGASPWKVTLEKVNVSSYFSNNDETVITNHCHNLETQLSHSNRTSEDGCPLFTPQIGVNAVHKYDHDSQQLLNNTASHPDSAAIHHMGLVWSLCVALWGNLPGSEQDKVFQDDSYSNQQGRKEALSRWLSETSEQHIKEEVQQNKFRGSNHLSAILSLLSGRQIPEACALAQKSGDHRLALLLAQTGSNFMARQMIGRQIMNWAELKADEFIDADRLKLYALLSGHMVWVASAQTVNTCENLDWKRALALHLWYLCHPNCSISEAVEHYDTAFKGQSSHGPYAKAPVPSYLETVTDWDMCLEEMDSGDNDNSVSSTRFIIHDMCYHLLKLYCIRSHRLERILTPTTSTPNQLDYRLSWHLVQVLQSLGYSHLSEHHMCMLHMSYAAQLESVGQWHWAVYVLLHLQHPHRRKKTVVELLTRHIRLSRSKEDTDKEEFLMQRLGIPEEWIHHAKAVWAHHKCLHVDEAWHLLKAQQWNESHKVILRHLASEALINHRYASLKRFLMELAPAERSNTIQMWPNGGRVYLDFITITDELDTLKTGGELNAYDIERLQPDVVSLCSRVSTLQCQTAKDRLCQSEMATRVASMLRHLLALQNQTLPEHVPARLLAPHFANLPLPEDYRLQELRALTRSHMLEMTA